MSQINVRVKHNQMLGLFFSIYKIHIFIYLKFAHETYVFVQWIHMFWYMSYKVQHNSIFKLIFKEQILYGQI